MKIFIICCLLFIHVNMCIYIRGFRVSIRVSGIRSGFGYPRVWFWWWISIRIGFRGGFGFRFRVSVLGARRLHPIRTRPVAILSYERSLHCLACYERSLHLDITLTYQAAMGHPLPAHIWKLKLDIMIICQRSKFRPCSGGNITSQQNNGLSYLIYSSIARTSNISCMWELRKSFPRQVIQSPHCLILAAHC